MNIHWVYKTGGDENAQVFSWNKVPYLYHVTCSADLSGYTLSLWWLFSGPLQSSSVLWPSLALFLQLIQYRHEPKSLNRREKVWCQSHQGKQKKQWQLSPTSNGYQILCSQTLKRSTPWQKDEPWHPCLLLHGCYWMNIGRGWRADVKAYEYRTQESTKIKTTLPSSFNLL